MKKVATIEAGTQQALTALQRGNHRFASCAIDRQHLADSLGHDSLTLAGRCRAVVLACSSMPVPAELLFDAGLGEIKVVRSAQLALTTRVLTRLMQALSQTPLLIVLGQVPAGDGESSSLSSAQAAAASVAEVVEQWHALRDSAAVQVEVVGAVWTATSGEVKFLS